MGGRERAFVSAFSGNGLRTRVNGPVGDFGVFRPWGYESLVRFNQSRLALRQARNRHRLRRSRIVMPAVFFKARKIVALKD